MSNNKKSSKKIAIVSPLYGTDLTDDISVQSRTIVNELKDSFDITVLTTCANDNLTWRNNYPEGELFIDDARVIRFPVKSERKIQSEFGYKKFLEKEWNQNDEDVVWLAGQGPYTTDLCNYLHSCYSAYDVIIFVDCISYTTAFCMLEIPNAVLIPLVSNKEILYINHFKKVFAQPQGFIFQSQDEQNYIYSLFPYAKEKAFIINGSGAEDFSKLINQVKFKRNINVIDSYNCDTYINRKVTPAFKNNNIAVVFSSDDRYLYILSVALQSLIDNISSTYNYDICIVSDGIQERKKNLLRLICSNKKNISLRFIEISKTLDSLPLKTSNARLSRTIFARLYIPEMFSEYSKVLYLDGDIIIKKDIAELYNTKIDNYYFAAVPDASICQLYKFTGYVSEYLESIGIIEKEKYFNSGVLLYNIAEFKKNYSASKMVDMIAKNKFYYDEQDAFNCFAGNHVKLLEIKWNLIYHEKITYQEILMLSPEYIAAYNNPYIIHYAGGNLPTSVENSFFSTDFWNVARKTPCYESVLNIAINNYKKRNVPEKHKKINKLIKAVKWTFKLWKKKGLKKTIKHCIYRLKYFSDF